MIKKSFSPVILFFSLVCLLAGCADTPSSRNDRDLEITPLKSIVVLPAQSVFSADPASAQNKELAAGADILDSLVQKYFLQNSFTTEFHFVSAPKMEALLGNMSGNIISQARLIASELKSEGVLILNVSRFRERVGTSRSVSSPASAAFDYKLINGKSGAVLCNGSFEETQQPLTENLLDFAKASRRGFKWITVEELVWEGLSNKFSECPYLAINEE